jgi:hypothetical protein
MTESQPARPCTVAAPGRIRVYINEGAVYDGDPEHDENAVLITGSQLRHWAGEPVTEELLAACVAPSRIHRSRTRSD